MTRIRLIYALLIALSLALHGCGDDGTGAQDASDEKDAASGDSGLDERDPDDLCAGVTCVDDGNVCTANRCDPSSGECEAVPLSHVSCEDGLFCNGNDVCLDGVCTHSGDPCGGGDSCVEEHKACGCETAADCPAGDWGAWSECDCDDPENVCENDGTRTRTRVTYACEDALCVATDILEEASESCSCDTNGLECFIPGPVVAGRCVWGHCNAGACARNECAEPLDVCDNESRRCVECASNTHCDSPEKPYCDTDAGACVECLTSDACGDGEQCCTTGSSKYTCIPSGVTCLAINPTTIPTTTIPTTTIPTTINPTTIIPTTINPTTLPTVTLPVVSSP